MNECEVRIKLLHYVRIARCLNDARLIRPPFVKWLFDNLDYKPHTTTCKIIFRNEDDAILYELSFPEVMKE